MNEYRTDFEKLCYACRVGDLENVDRLAAAGVNLNGVDNFDNSPLFLASLCGHEEVVKLLLERGAICDRDRYEGARCIYGALTDIIRDILLAYDISKAVDTSQPFATHISSLLSEEEFLTNGLKLVFKQDNEHIDIHQFLLKARCVELWKTFFSASNKFIPTFYVPTNNRLKIFTLIIKFIYLIPVIHEIKTTEYPELIDLSKELKLETLSNFLDKLRHVTDPSEKSSMIIEFQFRVTEEARLQLCNFVENNIFLNTIDPKNLKTANTPASYNSKIIDPSADILLLAKDSSDTERIYPCHISILSRAHYFQVLFSLPFSENHMFRKLKNNNDSDAFSNLPVISLPPCEFIVAEIVIRYLYYDDSDIPWEYSIDVLLIADFLLEDRLKSMSAIVITQDPQVLKNYSIFEILDVAWQTRMERLEHFVAKILAKDIRKYYKSEEFKDAIMKSSKRISEREETDTIELVDDIRYYLLEKYSLEPDDIQYYETVDDIRELQSAGILDYRKDLDLIDQVLHILHLNA
ncbi:hypothetical protein Kpol_499p22 [Vanderwaltozyma polyspora DSM 70294]|uniref:BTB domain-containing protein n=1 Tax=Vanderwaltozyma polyspora (strain ATCC 22028 / DSM 70294 / BCRC 21397 / CBS 2163 / NBRC 10782 / NRRL Y-8283 / UCD 57-17) TaxID=436907 RepID=A7TP25_VANPO|nr:uncharacterized protein Kpol_499p22 [Vanderwaltozyma polyspora DSM 70294]EDO15994.1 hypothetical protein Kpol_499p22 [Vanderwaltozyma polyspora DSM 70294]